MPNRSKQLVLLVIEYKASVKEACSVFICWYLCYTVLCACGDLRLFLKQRSVVDYASLLIPKALQ